MVLSAVNPKLEAPKLRGEGSGWDEEERERGGRVVAHRSGKNFAIGLSKEAWVKGGGARRSWERTQEFRPKKGRLALQGEFAYL